MTSEKIQSSLNFFHIKMELDDILSRWDEPHRHYHTRKHLYYILDRIELLTGLEQRETDILIVCALFHDIIYDPLAKDNEDQSAKFLLKQLLYKNTDTGEMLKIILETSDHKPTTKLSKIFSEIDMGIVKGSFDELLEWENGIYQEYKSYGPELYKMGRTQFLNSIIESTPENSENLIQLIDWVQNNY